MPAMLRRPKIPPGLAGSSPPEASANKALDPAASLGSPALRGALPGPEGSRTPTLDLLTKAAGSSAAPTSVPEAPASAKAVEQPPAASTAPEEAEVEAAPPAVGPSPVQGTTGVPPLDSQVAKEISPATPLPASPETAPSLSPEVQAGSSSPTTAFQQAADASPLVGPSSAGPAPESSTSPAAELLAKLQAAASDRAERHGAAAAEQKEANQARSSTIAELFASARGRTSPDKRQKTLAILGGVAGLLAGLAVLGGIGFLFGGGALAALAGAAAVFLGVVTGLIGVLGLALTVVLPILAGTVGPLVATGFGIDAIARKLQELKSASAGGSAARIAGAAAAAAGAAASGEAQATAAESMAKSHRSSATTAIAQAQGAAPQTQALKGALKDIPGVGSAGSKAVNHVSSQKGAGMETKAAIDEAVGAAAASKVDYASLRADLLELAAEARAQDEEKRAEEEGKAPPEQEGPKEPAPAALRKPPKKSKPTKKRKRNRGGRKRRGAPRRSA